MLASENVKKGAIEIARHSAQIARVSALRMTSKARASHIGSSLSVMDVLSILFAVKFNSSTNANDEIILSKGHASAALYAVLDSYGELNVNLDSYCENGSQIYGHVNHHASRHVSLSTGSLGHGFPFAVGIALAKKKLAKSDLTVVVISDGELNEGTTWESTLVAAHHELSNLIVVVDRNKIQSLGFTEDTLKLEPVIDKFEAFGWETRSIDGHSYDEIYDAVYTQSNKPICVIASTTKGKGVKFMENTIEWHYKSPNESELIEAISEINQGLK